MSLPVVSHPLTLTCGDPLQDPLYVYGVASAVTARRSYESSRGRGRSGHAVISGG